MPLSKVLKVPVQGRLLSSAPFSHRNACAIHSVLTVFSPLGIKQEYVFLPGVSFHDWINISQLLDSLWFEVVVVTTHDDLFMSGEQAIAESIASMPRSCWTYSPPSAT